MEGFIIVYFQKQSPLISVYMLLHKPFVSCFCLRLGKADYLYVLCYRHHVWLWMKTLKGLKALETLGDHQDKYNTDSEKDNNTEQKKYSGYCTK